MILRCTRKLLDVIKPTGLAEVIPDSEDWYANLLWIERRKCLLLMHAATFFTVFEPDVRTAGLRDTGRTVTGLIARELAREGLPPDTFGELGETTVELAKTKDRSVVSSMNSMADYGQAILHGEGGLAAVDLANLNQSLRRNILSSRAYHKPIELVAERLKSRS